MINRISYILSSLILIFTLVGCASFQTPKTVVDSDNGITIEKDPPAAQIFADKYLIPTLIAIVLGSYFNKCADTGNCN